LTQWHKGDVARLGMPSAKQVFQYRINMCLQVDENETADTTVKSTRGRQPSRRQQGLRGKLSLSISDKCMC